MILTQSHCLSFLLPPDVVRSQHLFSTSFHTKRVLNFDSLSLRHSILTSIRASKKEKESAFFDDNGSVQDMDGYLNYLALEYDSVWDTKPNWCQPWTITVTGVMIVALSWLVLHSVGISVLALMLIGAWWYVFLYSYPKQYADMIAERRRKITDGVEDTYGSKGRSP